MLKVTKNSLKTKFKLLISGFYQFRLLFAFKLNQFNGLFLTSFPYICYDPLKQNDIVFCLVKMKKQFKYLKIASIRLNNILNMENSFYLTLRSLKDGVK